MRKLGTLVQSMRKRGTLVHLSVNQSSVNLRDFNQIDSSATASLK